MLIAAAPAHAQGKMFRIEKDTIPLFKGFSVSFNLAGLATRVFSTSGTIEGALRINLHDQYFPIVELGYGMADHDDEVTGLWYKTQAPFFRIGCDLNLLKKKHQKNRLFGGLRYAFTAYKVDVSHRDFPDPVWQWNTHMSETGMACNQHWIEAVFGLDAYIYGPLHLGWDVRYKRRIAHKDPHVGQSWYIPGYGEYGDTRLTANFNVIIDI